MTPFEKSDFLTRLLSITDGCRDDMHEPDEQDVIATVVGDHLDNAMGDVRHPYNCGEFIVTIRQGRKLTGYREEHFNLATLIAFARMAPDPATTFTVARASGVRPATLAISGSLNGVPAGGDASYRADAQKVTAVLTHYLPSGTLREVFATLQAQEE